MTHSMIVSIKVTDTDGHEPAFSWVKIYSLDVPEDMTRYALARKVKRIVGWSGKRCTLIDKDNQMELRPYGENIICYIDKPKT